MLNLAQTLYAQGDLAGLQALRRLTRGFFPGFRKLPKQESPIIIGEELFFAIFGRCAPYRCEELPED
jgi:hypothetical protein